jgi:hypothetical protein
MKKRTALCAMKKFPARGSMTGAILAGLLALAASSCLQTAYDESLMAFQPQAAADISSRSFDSSGGSDMLIVTLYGGTFQDTLEADQFILEGFTGSLGVPVRESDTQVIFIFSPALPNRSYRIIVKKEALKEPASMIRAQTAKSGTWNEVSGSGFDRSRVWSIAQGGGKFVAAGDEGKMAYSLDGLNWTPIRPGTNTAQSKFRNTIRGLAWGDGN